eukprot:4825824-Amphidinium_carterae.1
MSVQEDRTLVVSFSFLGFRLLTCTIGYAVLGQLILVPIFGSALMKWSRRVLTREASLRAALVQVREHAESLAFYQ